jgi:hypothetical protein
MSPARAKSPTSQISAPLVLDANRSAASVILEDFSAMRNAGLKHPLMEEIEELLAHNGS